MMVSKFIKQPEFTTVVYRYYRTIIIKRPALAIFKKKSKSANNNFNVIGLSLITIGCPLRSSYFPDFRLRVAKSASSCIFYS